MCQNPAENGRVTFLRPRSALWVAQPRPARVDVMKSLKRFLLLQIVLQIQTASDFTALGRCLLGTCMAKRLVLEGQGYLVIPLPFFAWEQWTTSETKARYLLQLLQLDQAMSLPTELVPRAPVFDPRIPSRSYSSQPEAMSMMQPFTYPPMPAFGPLSLANSMSTFGSFDNSQLASSAGRLSLARRASPQFGLHATGPSAISQPLDVRMQNLSIAQLSNALSSRPLDPGPDPISRSLQRGSPPSRRNSQS